jgi:serine/threonine protein kinase
MTPGINLGSYEIAPIGAGGMGEVYKARDTRLDRIVAIKIAKGNFSERFERPRADPSSEASGVLSRSSPTSSV